MINVIEIVNKKVRTFAMLRLTAMRWGLICISICFISSINHALYLSIIEIEHSTQTKTANIRVKVFTDDLQDALRNYDASFVPKEEASFCQNTPAVLTAYFGDHLTIKINNTSSKLQFIDCQQENDVYWLNFKMECPSSWDRVSIQADFFMELFPTQSNIIHLSNDGKKTFYRLTAKENSLEASF